MKRYLARSVSVLTRRRIAAGVVAVLAVAGVSGLAYAETSGSPSQTHPGSSASEVASTPTPGQGGGGAQGANPGGKVRNRAAGLLRRAIHVELIVPGANGGGYRTIDADRGTVTAISSSSITISRPDGKSVSASVDSSTRFRGGVRPQVGDQAVVIQSNGAAMSVAKRPAAGSASSGSLSPGSAAPGGGSGGPLAPAA